MKKRYISGLLLTVFLIGACQGLKNTNSKGSFIKRIQRVTPADIENHFRKIIVNKYNYEVEDSDQSTSSLMFETAWKRVQPTTDEEAKGLSDIQVRFRIRSQETRQGPQNKYNVHNLRLIAEVEAYQSTNGSSNWLKAELTPERREYLENIYNDFKLEFDTGVMEFN